ncbi:SLC13 family permease [Desulfogranum japonicum]|uniref:SLC13 family permease n=1 Tax=Desulfogranum japonicum TaxID=231447 RepID=UPI0004204F0C|nr:SLC13 family permease [Desulfogranum japonicum]
MSQSQVFRMIFYTLGIFFLGFEALQAAELPNQGAPTFTFEMGIVFSVLILVILLFVFEWVRVDVVGILMMVALPMLNLVTPQEAISGLSSNAVVAIIGVIIIGAGLDKTGCMNLLARYILKISGKSEKSIVVSISVTVAFISSFMQNIGAAALFLPAVRRIGRQTGISPSKILLPMAYCAIIGGTITLVGASPTILLNDLIYQANELNTLGTKVEPLGMFTQTPIGIALVLAAICYFMFLGRMVMPNKKDNQEDSALMPASLADTYQEIAGVFEVDIPDDFGSFTLEELHVRDKYHVSIAGVYSHDTKQKNYAPTRYELIHSGETLAMVGNEEHVRQCAEDLGWIFKGDLDTFAEDFSPNNAGMVEGIITPRSELVGTNMRERRFRKRNGIVPVVLCRDGICQFNQITKETFKTGDALLMFGRWEKFRELSKKECFAFTTEIKGEVVREEKAKVAFGWLLITLAMILWLKPVAAFLGFQMNISLSICLLTGALGMVLFKVLSIDEAYRSIDWMTIFLLAGLIPLGLAFQKSGAAEWMATTIMGVLGVVPEGLFLLIIGVLTSFFTLVVSNVGATVLLVPLAMDMATETGVDPRLAAMVVALAASNTFVLPTHQVNALVMRPGGYQTMDYIKTGTGMTLLFLIVLTTMLMLFY